MIPSIEIDSKLNSLFTEKPQQVSKPANIIELKPKKTRKEVQQELISRNSRTVFIGNLPLSTTEKSHTKELREKFSVYGPIESIRFRSIAIAGKIPRKQAFITKAFHEKRDSVNAYIVFTTSQDAKKALELNGTIYNGKHIRVDTAELDDMKNAQDSQKSIFVGNLNFDISDEELWGYFAQVGDIEHVRVIRDRKTNVGKGFGYVQFKDKSSVGLALKLNNSELSGRKLRISRSVEQLAHKDEAVTAKSEGLRANRERTVLKTKIKGKVVKKTFKNKNTSVSSKPTTVKTYGGSNTVPRIRTVPKKPRHVPRPKKE